MKPKPNVYILIDYIKKLNALQQENNWSSRYNLEYEGSIIGDGTWILHLKSGEKTHIVDSGNFDKMLEILKSRIRVSKGILEKYNKVSVPKGRIKSIWD